MNRLPPPSEREHQALDLLDSLELEAAVVEASATAWAVATSEETTADEVSWPASLEAALAAAREDLGEVAAALKTVDTMFDRLVAEAWLDLLTAGRELAASGELASLKPEDLLASDEAIAARPQRALALGPLRELIALVLGLDQRGLARASLEARAARLLETSPAALQRCSAALDSALRHAWPREPTAGSGSEPRDEALPPPQSSDEPTPRALQHFRVALLARAGPTLRARALAADRPRHLPLAVALLAERPEAPARELVTAFHETSAELEARGESREDSPADAIDGPKRKFTWMHLVLALVVLGLTLWQYLFR